MITVTQNRTDIIYKSVYKSRPTDELGVNLMELMNAAFKNGKVNLEEIMHNDGVEFIRLSDENGDQEYRIINDKGLSRRFTAFEFIKYRLYDEKSRIKIEEYLKQKNQRLICLPCNDDLTSELPPIAVNTNYKPSVLTPEESSNNNQQPTPEIISKSESVDPIDQAAVKLVQIDIPLKSASFSSPLDNHNKLHERVLKIYKDTANNHYDSQAQSDFIEIGLELVKKRDTITPNCSLFHKPNLAQRKFMADWLYLELESILCDHPDHQVNDEIYEGVFSDLFQDTSIDYDQAMSIATITFKNKNGETKPISNNKKVEHLYLPDHWQDGLVVLRHSKLKIADKAANRKRKSESYKAKEKYTRMIIESQNVRHRLTLYAETAKSRINIKDIDKYVNVWIAIQISGGDEKNLVGTRKSYIELTGEIIHKSWIQRKRDILNVSGNLPKIKNSHFTVSGS
jgi:hypothetical protein